jgi:hypothetical protein
MILGNDQNGYSDKLSYTKKLGLVTGTCNWNEEETGTYDDNWDL